MSTKKLLLDLAGSIATATTDAPDEYPDWLPKTWKIHKEDIEELWAQIRPKLRRDLEQANILDQKIAAMIVAFDNGEKIIGRKIAWDIYNSRIEGLR